MPASPRSPQLSISLPQDAHFLRTVEQGWRTDLRQFVEFGLPKLLAALLIAFIFLRVVLFFVRRMRRTADGLVGNSRRASQLRTMAAILRATAYGIVGFYLIAELLGAIGVSLGPIVASASVIGLGISFGAQSLFKDVLTGIFILVEDQFSVGDTVKLAGLTGTVEDLSLRITRLRDGDGTLYIVPNSQITTVSNLSRDFAIGTLNVSVDARENPDHVTGVLRDLAATLRKDEAFNDVVIADPNVLGVDKISGYEVVYLINVRVQVNQRDAVLREMRRRILLAFTREGIAFGSSSSTLVLQSPESQPGAANESKAPTQTDSVLPSS